MLNVARHADLLFIAYKADIGLEAHGKGPLSLARPQTLEQRLSSCRSPPHPPHPSSKWAHELQIPISKEL